MEGGVFYFKLINKTSWQEHCLANIGCSGRYIMPGSALKLVRVHDTNNNSCIMFIIFTSPKPGGDRRSIALAVSVCVCVSNVNVSLL